MSTYPGEPPSERSEPTGDDSDTEPTQPVGYWERQAAEQAASQPPPPPTPYPSGGQTPHGQSPYGQSPYNQGPYAGQPYAGQPPLPGQAGPHPGQPVHPPGPHSGPLVGHQPYGFTPPLPDHPQATTALVLGLVGVVGAFILCGITLVVSPFAWAVGRSAVRDIEASQGRLGGESNARAGMILGIIGTVLLVLALIAAIGFVVLVIAAGTASTTGSSV